MRALLLIGLSVILVGCSPKEEASPEVTEAADGTMVFPAGDGVSVHARLYKGVGDLNGVVLMFHQAGSNMHEYDPIVQRVTSNGWDALTVDLRSGGTMWEYSNLTVRGIGESQDYQEAYADMEAALAWAESKTYDRIVVWGSSYSASLALRLAAEHSNIAGVVAFSPGEYFGERGVVARWASQVDVPVFFGSTWEEFVAEVQAIKDARADSPSSDLDVAFGDAEGVHGSSTLRPDRAPNVHNEYWRWVDRFLDSLVERSIEF